MVAEMHLPLKWAQTRTNVTISIDTDEIDEKSVNVEFEDQSFSIKATGSKSSVKYDMKIELYQEIDKDRCHFSKTRHWVIVLVKKDDSIFWPRLQKDKIKLSFISVDWNQWKDEDELDKKPSELPDGFDMSQFGDMDPESLPDFGDLDN